MGSLVLDTNAKIGGLEKASLKTLKQFTEVEELAKKFIVADFQKICFIAYPNNLDEWYYYGRMIYKQYRNKEIKFVLEKLGEIKINGEQVIFWNSFERVPEEITPYLKYGAKNTLKNIYN